MARYSYRMKVLMVFALHWTVVLVMTILTLQQVSCFTTLAPKAIRCSRIPSFRTPSINPLQHLQRSQFLSPSLKMVNHPSSQGNSRDSAPSNQTMTKNILWKAATIFAAALILWKRQTISSFLHFVKDEWLLVTLDKLNAAGPLGLVIYTIAFVLWQMTFGITTPIETAAGMAFGVTRGILTSGLAKFGGALLTFFLARYQYKERVQQKMNGNELLELMEESIEETPFRVALLCRFAPLPEFVKNAGMGILPVPRRWFIASLIVHGFSFTCLWTCMGAETAQVLRGMSPSATLKYLMTGATWIGFGAPVGIALWIKSLKDKQRWRRESMATILDETASDELQIHLSEKSLEEDPAKNTTEKTTDD